MKKRLIVLLMLSSLLSLTGCSYAYLERQVYPICLSVDMDEEGAYTIGVQAPAAMSSGSQPVYDVLTASGDTFDDAFNTLAASTPYPINFSQIRLCLIGYHLASTTNLRPLLRTLFEQPSMRSNACVMIALGNAAEVMAAQKPDLGMRLSTHLNILFEQLRQDELLPDSSLAACVRDLESGMSDPLLLICAINAQLQNGQGGGESGGESDGGGGDGESVETFVTGEPWSDALLPEDLLAGMLPQTSVNPVEYLGCAAVADGRVSGVLTARETQIAVHALNHCTRRVAVDGDYVQFQLLVAEAGEIETTQAVLSKLHSLHCDAMGFGWAAASRFLTDDEWEAFGFDRRYREGEAVVGLE